MSSGFPVTATSNLFGSQPTALNPNPPPTSVTHFTSIPAAPNFNYTPYSQYTSQQRIKLKRTRQRVDAGEPRNTYSTIPNYNTCRGPSMSSPQTRFGSHPGALLPHPMFSSSPDQMSKLFQGYSETQSALAAAAAAQSFNPLLPQMHNAWLRLQQHTSAVVSSANCELERKEPLAVNSQQPREVLQPSSQQKEDFAPMEPAPDAENGNEAGSNSGACKVCDDNETSEENDSMDQEEAPPNEKAINNKCSVTPVQNQEHEETVDTTEDIKPVNGVGMKELNGNNIFNASSPQTDISPRSKRKQYTPQQLESGEMDEHEVDEMIEQDDNQEQERQNQMNRSMDDDKYSLSPTAEPETHQPQSASNVNKVQELLEMQRQWYLGWVAEQQKSILKRTKEEAERSSKEKETAQQKDSAEPKTSAMGKKVTSDKTKTEDPEVSKDLKNLAQTLKSELMSSLSVTVDKIVNDYLQQETARIQAAAVAQQQLRATAEHSTSAYQTVNNAAANPRPFYMNNFYPNFPYVNLANPLHPGSLGAGPTTSIFPNGFPNPYVNAGAFGTGPRKEMDSFSLVMPRKKRSKVTDTRLSKVPTRSEEDSPTGSPSNYGPPTMVGHSFFGAGYAGLEDRDADSPENSDISELGPYDPNMPISYTLTPMHLRKAKLMFFYTRYPSSTLLKTYFPDIRFNKNNTAQLVKWFSNFREFYYIQMEKYGRQALAEGIRRPEDIVVTTDTELYKILNQHYNRNNHIQVPPSFRDVVEATMREFFLAIQTGKDSEPSWKKQIYKVIARLDDTIPDYFKNPNFLDQLE